MQAKPVRLERAGDIALILIDHPPVNALCEAVCTGLLGALGDFAADSSLHGAVIACEGRTFVAGADIRDFDTPSRAEHPLNVALRALDASRKPVVAAIHGTALGGGFELALACHARVIAPDGHVGLPEVRIGVIPGGGGTQRLPRLVGPMAALDIITTGRHVGAGEAMALGLVDEMATDLRRAAIARAKQLADSGQTPRVADRGIPAFDRGAWQAAVAQAKRRARGATAPLYAIQAIETALTEPLPEGLAREHALFLTLRNGPQSKALRHLFHAERVAARMPEGTHGWPVRRVGVVGGGTMGSGIAIALADSGLDVTLAEIDPEAANAASDRVSAVYDRQLRGARLSEALHRERTGRIRTVHELHALRDADLVIEAVVEDMATKKAVFRALSGIVRRDAVLASNTSYLDVNELADVVDAPERVVGMHFFSPAHVMRLLEIVKTRRTWPEVLATAQTLGRRLGKVGVVAGVCDGFIGNRILAKWRAQAEYALEDGATVAEVDAALEAYGMAMGIFAVFDLAGLDVDWAMRKRRAAHQDKRERVVPVFDQICQLGRFGQKTGRGFYLYQDGNRVVDPEVTALVEAASAARGIVRAPVPPEAIQQRVHAAMVNEAAQVLADGIAARPSDIDLVLVHGYGYPAWRGGPLHEADTIGIPEMLKRVEALHAASGVGWEPAALLREMATMGKSFADLNR
ncbi:MAG: 3-hydroxyacyl-CoA dehydrogenase NAD-binding domain-containing protein [Acetobacteraceae bacterium]|nr:3-hydroxyacyl-CoA dehydrogenase NAD-binding domain-containing protein [Acetobacteraceae bacterium]